MTRGLRIAMIAPAHDCVPSPSDAPAGNGIRALADALTALGHTVLVCAPMPSHCDARIAGTVMRGHDGDNVDYVMMHLTRSIAAIERFKPDVVHDFSGFAGLVAEPGLGGAPLIVTVCEPVSRTHVEILRTIAQQREASNRATAFIAGTEWIRSHISGVDWQATIVPAVSVRDAVFTATKQPFAVYAGPITSDAGILRILQAARVMQMPLRVVRRHARAEEDAFLANHISTHVGIEVDIATVVDAQSERRLLADATVLLTTEQTHQRVPHVTVRALASGTPVLVVTSAGQHSLALQSPGTILSATMAELGPRFIDTLVALDPYECRRIAAVTYGAQVSAHAYEQVYAQLGSAHVEVVDLRAPISA